MTEKHGSRGSQPYVLLRIKQFGFVSVTVVNRWAHKRNVCILAGYTDWLRERTMRIEVDEHGTVALTDGVREIVLTASETIHLYSESTMLVCMAGRDGRLKASHTALGLLRTLVSAYKDKTLPCVFN